MSGLTDAVAEAVAPWTREGKFVEPAARAAVLAVAAWAESEGWGRYADALCAEAAPPPPPTAEDVIREVHRQYGGNTKEVVSALRAAGMLREDTP